MGTLFLIFLAILCLLENAPWAQIGLCVWFIGISALHAIQEIRGELWEYFGKVTGNRFVKGLGPVTGSLFIVLPAFALQAVAAWKGLLWEHAFWLALLIGARLGDALFSHFLPSAMGHRPNPGYVSAVVYLVDGLVLLSWNHHALAAHPAQAWSGALVGAGFFATIQPVMRITAPIFQK